MTSVSLKRLDPSSTIKIPNIKKKIKCLRNDFFIRKTIFHILMHCFKNILSDLHTPKE